MVNLKSLKLISVGFVVLIAHYVVDFLRVDSTLSTESCICGRGLWSCWRWSVGWWWR